MYPDLTTHDLDASVLLLLDLQVALCTGSGPLGRTPLSTEAARTNLLPRVASALQAWRAAGRRVIHVRVGMDPARPATANRTERFRGFVASGALQLGNPDAEFVPEAAPAEGEPVVTKTCVDPFVGTPLPSLLQGTQTLLLAGVATNFAVESAARHASDLGFHVWVLADLCVSHDRELHDFAVRRTLPAFARVASAADLGLLG